MTYSRQQRHKARAAKVVGGPGTLRVEQEPEPVTRVCDEDNHGLCGGVVLVTRPTSRLATCTCRCHLAVIGDPDDLLER